MAKVVQRIVVASLFATGLVAGSTTLAFADDHPTPTPGASGAPAFGTKTHHEDGEGEDDHHAEIHDKYGKDVDQVFLPPLVVKDAPAAPTGTTNKSSINGGPSGVSPINPPKPGDVAAPATTLKDAGAVDPAANVPVNPDTVAPSTQTPADKFFQVASVGLGAMTLGSVALGGIVVVQRIRQRN
ncbi:MAG: hypothetical protein RLZZ164_809 [Actinomycetota bacterium]